MNTWGFLNIDKPKGQTSHDIVVRTRRLLRLKKIGHAGTLDPMATGVLILCVGPATRLSEYVMGHPKTYQATLHFGITTDTYDAEGQIIQTETWRIEQAQLEAVLPRFTGDIEQIPPMYSAIKQGGKKLYELARKGQIVERSPRPVTIYRLQLTRWYWPYVDVEVICSPGTYIRSLAHDIGQAVGTGAHLSRLHRIASGVFTLANAVTWPELAESAESGNWLNHLHSVDFALSDIPRLDLNTEAVKIITHGGTVPRLLGQEAGPQPELVRAYDPDGTFIALLEATSHQPDVWKPKKVFV
jgi:tRNA pseudouridine55 synthase